MRVLVGWDDPLEAETIGLILNVEETTVEVTADASHFELQATQADWDVLLMAIDFPDEEGALPLFKKVQDAQPNIPIAGAGKQGQFTTLAKFISHGLHSHLMRDAEGDFIFLLPSMIEAAQAAVIAQRSRILGERLREEVDSVRRLQESVIHDLDLLKRFAQLASIALENARLYTLSQQELAERRRIADALQIAEEK